MYVTRYFWISDFLQTCLILILYHRICSPLCHLSVLSWHLKDNRKTIGPTLLQVKGSQGRSFNPDSVRRVLGSGKTVRVNYHQPRCPLMSESVLSDDSVTRSIIVLSYCCPYRSTRWTITSRVSTLSWRRHHSKFTLLTLTTWMVVDISIPD